jgi:16S rRNA (guanine1207-N2)-methyltransferase
VTPDTLRTLFHPFETEALEWPPPDGRGLFLNARSGAYLPSRLKVGFHLVQGFRPDYLKLASQGYAVAPRPEGGGYDIALLLTGRHRGQNESWIAEALRRTKPGGRIVVAGGKTDGIDSLRKRLSAVLELDGSLAKHHGTVFWLTRPAEASPALADLTEPPAPTLIEGRFRTAPGMFSSDRVDPGSRFLGENLPLDIAGAAADFCAGWGYLSAVLLERCAGVQSIDVFEADFDALEAGKANLAGIGKAELAYHWLDLLSEPVGRIYDAIVMNPPFHAGRAGDPSIGQAMIKAASGALKPNGRLFLVANRHLPYEAAVQAGFRSTGELARNESYKLLWGRR